MPLDTTNINSIKQLYEEFKVYLELQKEYTRLEVVEKLSILLSTLLILLLMVLLGGMVLFYLLFALAHALAPHLGSLSIGFTVIAASVSILSCLIYICRKSLIINPIARFLSKLFIEKSEA